MGVCKLTGHRGAFVESHIIPRFIGDRSLGRASRVQYGDDDRPLLRHGSWYDPELTTRVGEDRLAAIDDAASKLFRRHGISWRHFPIAVAATRNSFADDLEIIEIDNVDCKQLQLFLLSLLWRAAASTRVEFADIVLTAVEIERLRKIVAGEVVAESADFPSILVLLTTKGDPQMHTPRPETILMAEANRASGLHIPDIPIFRFFLDGLIVHMGRRSRDHDLADLWGQRVVGSSNKLVLIGRPYERSRQEAHLAAIEARLFEKHPERAASIYRTLAKDDR